MRGSGIAIKKTTDKKKIKKRFAIVAGSVLGVFVLFWTVILIMGGIAVNGNEIFPNVKINGVSVGGVTEERALQKLIDATESYSDKSIDISFPNGSTISISAVQSGLAPEPDEAAEIAFEYGRTGNIFSNSLKYFKCLIGMGLVDINKEIVYTLDDTRLRAIISESTHELNSAPIEPSYEIIDEALYITKGTAGMTINEEELYNLVSEALLSSDFTPLSYDADMKEPAEVDLQSIYDAEYKDPQNSIYDKETGSVTQEMPGISFDIEKARKAIDAAPNSERVEIPLILTKPDITAEDLGELLFSSLLAAKTTDLTSNSNRNTNIELSAAEINGTVLNPGEEFSFNDVVGERTSARGFMPAGAYSGGQTVTEVGGGICQVSSTIYYTVLKSDLEVVNRNPHTFTVSYLPLGMDATVSWGGPEFVFKNNTDYPIKILAWRDGLTLTIELHGTKTNDYTIELDSFIQNTVSYSTEYIDDSSVPAGSSSVKTVGHTGYTVDTYRYVYDGNGDLIREEKVNTSSYSKLNQVVVRGTG